MEHDHGSMTGEMTNVKDPVCGMSVDPARAAATLHLGDRIFYFCSDDCRKTFIEDPDRYAGRVQAADGARPPANDVSPGDWTCPMHPEVRSSKPGPCPKCGMALEPVTPGKREWRSSC